MRKRWKGALRALPFVLLAVLFFALPFLAPREGSAEERRLVRIWNVDTFEGGKGSRASFLRQVARRTEKTREGVYYLVTDYTAEGARETLSQGDFPDLLSFGIGLFEFAELSLPLSLSFAGGERDGKCLAYPWCRGGYALFSLDEDFSEAGRTAISVGGENLSCVAALLHGTKGESVDSLSAYTGFLSGKYRYLLGTQRDLCRFSSRSVQVYMQSLNEYCDLYQYISLLSAERAEDCLAFLDELLSGEVQAELGKIGMYSVEGDGPFSSPLATVGVFTSEEDLSALRGAAAAGDGKKAEKYLKIL